MTPNVPTHPWASNPNGRPDLFPHLFTKRIENSVNNPFYRRPGSAEMTSTQAFNLVNWLNSLGFRFSKPRYKDNSTMEGKMREADPTDKTPRVYYAKFDDATPGVPDDDNAENDLARVADALGGWLSTPTVAIAQLGFENGLPPMMFRGLTDYQIVSQLTYIFGAIE